MYDPNNDTRGPREIAYDEYISPLMTRIIALCKKHKIPMVASYELDANEEDVAMYCTTCLQNDSDMKPSDDRIERAVEHLHPPPPQWSAFVEYADGTREKIPGSG